ncbi:MAG: hypothetical protein HYV97_15790 [Bdellovibrio sp.]|nr:hypothetical protein [Bdellovibrio sp.]
MRIRKGPMMIALSLSLLGLVALANANEENTEKTAKTDSQTVSKEKPIEKKARRKKVEICSKCGKPEPECECHEGTKDATPKEE